MTSPSPALPQPACRSPSGEHAAAEGPAPVGDAATSPSALSTPCTVYVRLWAREKQAQDLSHQDIETVFFFFAQIIDADYFSIFDDDCGNYFFLIG